MQETLNALPACLSPKSTQLPNPNNKDSEQYLEKVFLHKVVYLILFAKKETVCFSTRKLLE